MKLEPCGSLFVVMMDLLEISYCSSSVLMIVPLMSILLVSVLRMRVLLMSPSDEC